ncbi:transglutaminase family protein [Nocardioides sp. R-C-SC26]|uniref:transglutaminase-like domain-containing protein n=1 Tax=Nocardioides sp. R-C-SC26 TaxID=2870414 RepID=UPI001E41725F|nr:transglutaminase family protein [Nocardioides sp. R-C-SC26]
MHAEPGTTPTDYLEGDEVVDVDHPRVRALGAELRRQHADDIGFAAAAFVWVRDEVQHSFDAGDGTVTLTAGEVLHARRGLCYAKSHLLAAILRGQGVPTALCYQRLRDDDLGEDGFVVHGLVALHLKGRWHRQDPRGNRPGVDAQFSLGAERLAWSVDPALGERDYARLHRRPARAVVEALRAADDMLTCALPSALDDPPLVQTSQRG